MLENRKPNMRVTGLWLLENSKFGTFKDHIKDHVKSNMREKQ